MKVLFVGDIVGQIGVDYVGRVLPGLISSLQPDLVVANAENAVKGRGLTSRVAEQLYDSGVELLTLGNHAFDQREVEQLLATDRRVIRPANMAPGTPGQGYTVCPVNGKSVLLVNLLGRAFMQPADCPFRAIDAILTQHADIRHVVVDMHAEATSEKQAMGWHLAGRVSAVLGTHTHVPTADARILPPGTAYITDVGMAGPRDGILGMERQAVIHRMRSQMPTRFEVAQGPCQIGSVLVELDDETGVAKAIQRVDANEA